MGQREERSSSFLRQEQEALVPGGKQTKSKHIATSSFISSLRPKDQTPNFSSTEQSPNLGESFLLVYKADGTGNSRTGQSNLRGGWEGSWDTDAAAFKLFVKNLLKHFACTHHHHSWEVRENLKWGQEIISQQNIIPGWNQKTNLWKLSIPFPFHPCFLKEHL